MSFMDTIRTTMDNLFVPKDGLYYQAKDLIGAFDSDGDGRINIEGLRQSGGNALLLGTPGRGFAAADEGGNGNGVATIREVRNHLKQFDTGNGFDPASIGDRYLDGIEMLRMIGDAAIGGLFRGGGGEAPGQALRGAESVG